jgi:hypothetical protein
MCTYFIVIIYIQILISIAILGENESLHRNINITETSQLPQYVSQIDAKTNGRTRNLIGTHIVVDNLIQGFIFATNAVHAKGDPFGAIHIEKSEKGERKVVNIDSSLGMFDYNDELLLGFVAANAGIIMKHTIMMRTGTLSNTIPPSHHMLARASKMDANINVQKLIENAYIELEADLISLFAYNDVTKRLECTVSRDIMGLSIPLDKGIAGIVFRKGRIINVESTDRDARHNRDVDIKVGYKTRTLLCSPILDRQGRPVGVIEALNRKGEKTYFTRQDEIVMCKLCSEVFPYMEGADYLRDCSDDSNCMLVMKFLDGLRPISSLPSLAEEARGLVMGSVMSDYVGLYTFIAEENSSGYLLCHNLDANDPEDSTIIGNTGKIPMIEMPSQIIDALRSGVMTEFNASQLDCMSPATLSTKSSKRNLLNSFLDGITASHALIYPAYRTTGKRKDLYSLARGSYDGNDVVEINGCTQIQSHSSVLVVIRSTSNALPFSEPARKVLSLFVAVLNDSMDRIIQKESHITIQNDLEKNFFLANSTLGTLEDFIMLLNSAGQVIAWNRNLSTLLGKSSSSLKENNGLHDSSGSESLDEGIYTYIYVYIYI